MQFIMNQNTKQEKDNIKGPAKSISSLEVWHLSSSYLIKQGDVIVLEERSIPYVLHLFILMDAVAEEAEHSGFVLKCFSVAPILSYE